MLFLWTCSQQFADLLINNEVCWEITGFADLRILMNNVYLEPSCSDCCNETAISAPSVRGRFSEVETQACVEATQISFVRDEIGVDDNIGAL